MTGERRLSLIVLAGGLVAFVALAAWLVPWHPYPGGPVHPPPASSVFTHAEITRAEDFSRWARVWARISLVLSLVAVLALARRDWPARLRGPWWLRSVQAVAIVEAVVSLATLLPDVLLQQRERRYHLVSQGWGGYATDRLTGLAVTVVAASIAVLAFQACVRRLPRAWPLVAGGLLAALVMGGSFVYPLLVEPLFNHFTALPAGSLRTQVLHVAAEEHVHLTDVLVVDASTRTTELNAYVSGFGASRRVVLFDNLLHQPRPEVLSVVAHELGHARYDDVLTGSLLGAAGAVVGIGLIGLVLRRPGRSVPALLAAYAVVSVLSLPVQDVISRQIETRADVAALTTTHDEAAFVELQKELALSSLQDPTPAGWSQFVFGSHPTALQRIAIAHRVLDPRR